MTTNDLLPEKDWKSPTVGHFRVILAGFHPDLRNKVGKLIGDFDNLDKAFDAADCDDGPYHGRSIRDHVGNTYTQCTCFTNPNDDFESRALDALMSGEKMPELETVYPSAMASENCSHCKGVGLVRCKKGCN